MANMTPFFIGTIKSFYFSEPSNATSCVENPPKDTAITISEATTTMAISDVNGNIAETMNDNTSSREGEDNGLFNILVLKVFIITFLIH